MKIDNILLIALHESEGIGWKTINRIMMTGMDGANRWKQTLNITLPGIAPAIVIILILDIGKILEIGFEKVYLLATGQQEPVPASPGRTAALYYLAIPWAGAHRPAGRSDPAAALIFWRGIERSGKHCRYIFGEDDRCHNNRTDRDSLNRPT